MLGASGSTFSGLCYNSRAQCESRVGHPQTEKGHHKGPCKDTVSLQEVATCRSMLVGEGTLTVNSYAALPASPRPGFKILSKVGKTQQDQHSQKTNVHLIAQKGEQHAAGPFPSLEPHC